MVDNGYELSDWIVHDPAALLALQQELGDEGLKRLDQLLSEGGGLTPSEAREWFDYDRARWASVEGSISCAIYKATMFKKVVPKHVMKWIFEHGDWALLRKTYPEDLI